MVFNVVVEVEGESGGVPQQTVGARGSSTGGGSASFSYGGGEQPSALALAAAGAGPALGADYVEEEDDEEAALLAPPVEQRRVSEDEQIGRNDPCWCGSGKKYKRCHGA